MAVANAAGAMTFLTANDCWSGVKVGWMVCSGVELDWLEIGFSLVVWLI